MSVSCQEEVRSQRIAFLREVSLFAGLSEEALAALADDFREQSYRPREMIFHQGDCSRALYVVKQGKVRVFRLNAEGEETTILILARRHVVGEFALIDDEPRSATAQAIQACTLLQIGHDPFWRHLETVPGLAVAMCQQVVRKARWTSMYVEVMAQLDVAGRLLHLLLLYLGEFGQEIVPGQQYLLDLGLNQSDLASMVGAQRGWVNRTLQNWRKRGLIEYDNGTITILDLPRMREEREGCIGPDQGR